MAANSSRLWRIRAVLLFAVLAAAAFYMVEIRTNAAGSREIEHYQEALGFIRGLSSRAADLFDEDGQRLLHDAALQLQFSLNYWTQYPDPSIAAQAQRDSAIAVSWVTKLLDRSAQVERVWAAGGAEPTTISRRWALGSGAVLLRIGRNGAADPGPRMVRAQLDLTRGKDLTVDVGDAETTYAALYFSNAPEGKQRIPIRLRAGSADVGLVSLAVATPPTGTLRISILDAATGKPTPAAAGVFAPDGEILTPTDAIKFDDGGFYYQPGRVRPHAQARYWPGSVKEQRAFFIDREFTLRLPEGKYRLIASKGPEFLPASETVAVKAGAETARQVTLRRWVDMPSRGWYSGDTHVHYARAGDPANRRLLEWTQAEDIHVASVLRMGDARETYFEQYGFGKEGRVATGAFALVPGQEDPRTNVIGHTLQLNLQRPVRFPDRYYQYDLVFDDVHSQGGITGYAHLYQPAGSAFYVRRDMALNVPAHRVDFAEICEFGDIGEDLYYEFLNMGFPLTASAGSDVPWGNTVGTSRVYAYTGDRFSADAWFAALKAGHTFVTTGAMLEFTVNGKIAGSEIEAKPGDMLRIKAAASGEAVAPRYLEVVQQGNVVRSTKSGTLEFTLPVTASTWIAARCFGAHTTPVYVKVNGGRFWKRDQVSNLVARRLDALDDLEKQLSRDLVLTHQGNWDGPEAWRQGAARLRERIQIARQTYEKMRAESR
jgi:hypothetical protein